MRPTRGRGADAGSLSLAMLLTLVGISLSTVLLPSLLTQVGSTRENTQRADDVDAAQAGLDVALAHVRAANDGAGNGVSASLPCGPLAGSVDPASTARYQVSIDYYPYDPKGRSASWLTANLISCVAGAGPASTPAYALLRSLGTDQASGSISTVDHRTLQATYVFQSPSQYAGGLIHVWYDPTLSSNDLCLDAGTTSPAAATNVQLQPCSPGNLRQAFAYNTNLTLVLVASKTATLPLGMCLDAGAAHALGRVVQFQSCASTTKPQQQWTFDDTANFQGTADGSSVDGFCFNVQSPDTAGSFVVLGSLATSTCQQGYDNQETFVPEISVGAGAAGPGSGQLVNAGEYARCLDVTQQDLSFAYLIAWPCKQATDPARLTWNQHWTLPAFASGATSGTGTIAVGGGDHCLRSPGSSAPGQYVTVATCPTGSTPVNLTWTVYTDAATYAASYRIQDGYGYCLSPTDPAATTPDLYSDTRQVSKMVVAACTGSAQQKWNAPAATLRLPLADVSES